MGAATPTLEFPMKQHPYRTLIIYTILVASLIQIYPTLGWTFALSSEERAARLEKWDQEDEERRLEKPTLFGDTWRSVKRWAEFDRDRVINLGLDLQGGIHMVVGFDVTEEQKARGYEEEEVQRLVLQRIRRRIADFEAKEPLIAALGTNQVQIQLPGEKDISRAERLIMKTAYLTFHAVSGPEETNELIRNIDLQFNNTFIPYLEPTLDRGVYEIVPENIDHIRRIIADSGQIEGLIPENRAIFLSQPPNPWDDALYVLYVADREAAMDGENLSMAQASPDPSRPGSWKIAFAFDGAGAQEFADVTQQYIGRKLAVVLDNVVVSAPVINERIFGSGEITGAFSQDQAIDLEISLNSGSMPVPIREDYKGIVGATLGADSVRKGVISSVLGIIAVGLFMVIYYHIGGLIANFALVLNSVLILAALSYFGATLTLPGIAGLILTIGMAVDANVLIFERIREELRNGKSLQASIEGGYARATITILDANVTTLIAALVLMEFGTGPIEGFAVTLSIGVCASVFTALVVTRAILDFLTSRKMLSNLTMLSIVKPGLKIKFLERASYAAVVSAVVIVLGLATFAYRGSDNFGVDFTAGTNMTVALSAEESIPVALVRERLMEENFTSPVVQEYTDAADSRGNEFVIRVGDTSDYGGTTETDDIDAIPVSRRVQEALAPLTDDPSNIDSVVLERVETVGPAVGQQLRGDALKAIGYALMFIVAYLWFRFELKFAVAAVIALIHDVLVIIGLFAFTGFFGAANLPDFFGIFDVRQITMPVVAALLTVVGYSLNDTIVVFDRVREDLKLYRGRNYSFMDILNISINQTLSRTILTSTTTLFVVVVLFFFGGGALQDFAFALIAGVVVGTYSSIFVAGPVVYLWERFRSKHVAPTSRKRPDDGPDAGPSNKPRRKKGGKGKRKSRRAAV